MLRTLRRINLVLLVVIVWQAFVLYNADAVKAQTAPFLYRPYYGPYVAWTATLDHKYPNYGATPSEFVRYTGESGGSNCANALFCYNGHSGYDFALAYKPIVASADGQISYAGWENHGNHDVGLGLKVIVDHNNSHQTIYGHLSAIRYQSGSNVGRWQIGTSGTTGNSSGPHLHFEVKTWHNGAWRIKDPYGWSGSYTDPWQQASGVQSTWLWMSNPLQNPPPNNGTYTVDDGDSKFFKGCYGGVDYWYRVTNAGNSGDLYWTYANGSVTDCWARWDTPSIPSSGQYEVLVYVPNWNGNNRTHAARYTVNHANGSLTVVVDQHRIGGSGQWISLGRYNFNQGSGNVTVVDAAYVSPGVDVDPTSRTVLVDAARWVKTH